MSPEKPEKEPLEAPARCELEFEDQDEVLVPEMRIGFLRHRLRCDTSAKGELMSIIEENEAVGFYEQLCFATETEPNAAKVKMWKENLDKFERNIEYNIRYSKESLGDSETRQQYLRWAHHLMAVGYLDRGLEVYEQAAELTRGTGGLLHMCLTRIRVFFHQRKWNLVGKEIEKGRQILATGGDWERRNKLNVYEGLYAMHLGDFERASKHLVAVLQTFTATEMISYERYILYAVCLATITLSRKDYKDAVIVSPDVRKVTVENEVLREFADAIYEGRFETFYVRVLDIVKDLKDDYFFGQHYESYLERCRVHSYQTFLAPFRNVKLATMAEAFRVSDEFMESEVGAFIADGRLLYRIDKVSSIIYSHHACERDSMLDQLHEEGDRLIAKVHQLSNVIV